MLRGKLVLCIILVLFAVAVLAKDYYKVRFQTWTC